MADGLWVKMWDVGVRGMYDVSRSAVLLDGEKSASFSVEQGVAQVCSLSLLLFSVCNSDLLKEVEKANVGIQLSSGKLRWYIGGFYFLQIIFRGLYITLPRACRVLLILYLGTVVSGDLLMSAVMVFSKASAWGE